MEWNDGKMKERDWKTENGNEKWLTGSNAEDRTYSQFRVDEDLKMAVGWNVEMNEMAMDGRMAMEWWDNGSAEEGGYEMEAR